MSLAVNRTYKRTPLASQIKDLNVSWKLSPGKAQRLLPSLTEMNEVKIKGDILKTVSSTRTFFLT